MGKKTKVREEERERNSSERGGGEIIFKISIPWDRQRRVQITLIISSPSLAYSQSFPYSYFPPLLFTLVHFPLPLLSSLLSLYLSRWTSWSRYKRRGGGGRKEKKRGNEIGMFVREGIPINFTPERGAEQMVRPQTPREKKKWGKK